MRHADDRLWQVPGEVRPKRRKLRGGNQHAFFHPFRQIVGILRRIAGRGALRLRFEVDDRVLRDVGPQALVVNRLADQVFRERRRRLSFRRVVRVHVPAHLIESDARGERRGCGSLGDRDGDRAGFDVSQRLARGRHVEFVAEAGAPGFEQYGEVVQAPYGGEEFLRLHPRQPQRHALIEALARQQQGATRAFAKPRAEEAAALQGPPQQRFEVVRRHQGQKRGRVDTLLDLRDDGVVVGVDIGFGIEALPPRGLHRERDGTVHATAPGGVQYDLLIAVGSRIAARPGADVFDQQVMPVRQVAVRRLALARQVVAQLLGGHGLECQVFAQMALEFISRAGGEESVREFQEVADALGKVETAVHVLCAPERRRSGFRFGRPDQHIVVRDSLDAPVLGAERKVLSDGCLPDELLVEFSYEGARLRVPQLEIASIGDRPARVVKGENGALARLQRVADPVESDARLEIADAGSGVAAGEHFDDQVELLPIQRRVRTRAPNRPVRLLDGARFRRGHRDQDLRQHVERVRYRRERLDIACSHRVCDGGGFQEVPRMGGKQRPPAGVADIVASASDALQRRGQRRRRLHQHDFVQIADVDPHLQRIGRDDGLQFAVLEAAFHLGADFPGQGTVMGIGDRAERVVVQLEGDLLCQPAAVGKEQRRTVGVDHVLEHVGQRFPYLFSVLCGVARRFREPHGQLDLLVRGGANRADRALSIILIAAADEPRDGVDGPHGRGQRDTLELARDFDQPFEARHQGGAAPVFNDGVNFVDDDGLHRRQRLPPPRGREQQQQALRRGDEDFRRSAQQSLAFSLRRVAAARRRAHARERFASVAEDIA